MSFATAAPLLDLSGMIEGVSKAEDVSLAIGGATIHARIEGLEGRPWVTCLHPLGGSIAVWEPQLATLTRHLRVLRLDMRGHGRSAATPPPYDLEMLAADVGAVWDQLGIARSAVLGLSIGGMIGLTVALARPDCVTRVLAADCRADAPPPFRAMWPARRALLTEGGMRAVARATVPTWLTEATRSADPDLASRIEDMIAGTEPAGYIGATHALETLDLLPRLAEIGCPVRYVVGAEDGVHPAAMAAMAAATPGAELVTIPHAAHLANVERPEAFDAALAFLWQDADHAQAA